MIDLLQSFSTKKSFDVEWVFLDFMQRSGEGVFITFSVYMVERVLIVFQASLK